MGKQLIFVCKPFGNWLKKEILRKNLKNCEKNQRKSPPSIVLGMGNVHQEFIIYGKT
jgi:hypothetical protein